jgi:glycine cleavage system protein P-like pyridoxal-binding family
MGDLDQSMDDCLLVACTEKRTAEQLDAFVSMLKEVRP